MSIHCRRRREYRSSSWSITSLLQLSVLVLPVANNSASLAGKQLSPCRRNAKEFDMTPLHAHHLLASLSLWSANAPLSLIQGAHHANVAILTIATPSKAYSAPEAAVRQFAKLGISGISDARRDDGRPPGKRIVIDSLLASRKLCGGKHRFTLDERRVTTGRLIFPTTKVADQL